MGAGNVIGVIAALVLIAVLLYMLFRPYKEPVTLKTSVTMKA